MTKPLNPSLNNFPVPLRRVEKTNSTNIFLRDLFRKEQLLPFTTVVADYQTAGRGQRSNSWESEEGRNLLFSFVFFPSFLEARRQFILSQIIALSIKDVLDMYTGEITIKWPNDIYWQERKICGILIENELQGSYICQTIVGVGININQQKFYGTAPNPVSLWQITHKDYDCMDILAQVMIRFQEYYTLLLRGSAPAIAIRYRDALFRKKGMYPYTDFTGRFLAEIVRVEPDGPLVLKDDTGKERKYAFKEIQYVL